MSRFVVKNPHGPDRTFQAKEGERATHEPAQETGIRVIVRERLDWPALGFELKAGVTHAETFDAWLASIPGEVRPKLAPFVRSGHVRVLDLSTNPPADAGEATWAQLGAP